MEKKDIQAEVAVNEIVVESAGMYRLATTQYDFVVVVNRSVAVDIPVFDIARLDAGFRWFRRYNMKRMNV